MEEEADVINYHRDFNMLSKPLLEAGRITEGEWNAIFWHGFHPDDCRALRERLIAKQPDKPNREAFDLQDVLQTTIAIFSGDDDFYFQEPPPRRNETNCVREQRAEYASRSSQGTTRDRHAARRDWHHQSPTSEDQESDDQEATDQDNYERLNRGHRHSSPHVETRTIQFQDNSCEEEDKELDNLIYKLHSLSVRDFAYKQAYVRCARCFPDALRGIPKPGYRDALPTAAYSYQPTALPPALPPWSAHAATAPTTAPQTASANAIALFFRTTL